VPATPQIKDDLVDWNLNKWRYEDEDLKTRVAEFNARNKWIYEDEDEGEDEAQTLSPLQDSIPSSIT
jgi:hypothetical protein